jgi:hypothetical protein
LHMVGRILARPFWARAVHRGLRMPLVVLHVVLGPVWAILRLLLLLLVGGVGRTRRRGDGWIYRYVGVRLVVVLGIVLAIWQRQRRTG